MAQETIVTYFKKNGGHTAIKDSAAFTRIIRTVPNEDGLYELNDYYGSSNNIKQHGFSSVTDPRRPRYEGLLESYYEHGDLLATAYYKSNALVDTAKRYYKNGLLMESFVYLEATDVPNDLASEILSRRLLYYADSLGNVQISEGNGTMSLCDADGDIERGAYRDGLREGRWEGTFFKAKYRFEEWYENGHMLKGITTDSLDKQYTYQAAGVQPEYPGGVQKLRQFIGQNYRYPKEAIRANVAGAVVISFVVDTAGLPVQIKIIDDLGYGTGAAGIEALKRSRRWKPGYHRGIPVRVLYTLPIHLNLAGEPSRSKTSSP